MKSILNYKYIDYSKCKCNDVHYIYLNYGIEAARNILYNEAQLDKFTIV